MHEIVIFVYSIGNIEFILYKMLEIMRIEGALCMNFPDILVNQGLS